MRRAWFLVGALLAGGVVKAQSAPDAGQARRELFASVPSQRGSTRATLEALVIACSEAGAAAAGGAGGLSQEQACGEAYMRAAAAGAPAAREALHAIDELHDRSKATLDTLYRVVAESGEGELVTPLVEALAIVQGGPRSDEARPIVDVLVAITGTPIGQAPPWQSDLDESRLPSTAARWQAFATAHAGQTRAQLRAARTTEALAQLDDADLVIAFQASVWLARDPSPEHRARARVAVQRLLKLRPLPPHAGNVLRQALQRFRQ